MMHRSTFTPTVPALGTSILAKILILVCAWSIPTDGFSQSAEDTIRVKKQVAKIDKKIASINKRIKKLETRVAANKKTLQRNHKRAFAAKKQEEAGAKLAALLKGHCGLETPTKSPEDIMTEFGIDYRTVFDFDPAFVAVTRQALIDQIGVLMEDKTDPTAIRCARTLKDVFDATPGKDFEAAWEALRKHSKAAKALDTMVDERESYEREKKDLTDSLTSGIKGTVPRGMSVVPASSKMKHGITEAELKKLSHDLGDEPEANYMLMFNSGVEEVTLPTFAIDRYEITHRAYWVFCQATDRSKDAYPQHKAQNPITKKDEWKQIWVNGEIPEGWDNRPITWLRYEDFEAYAKWTNSHIPTECEWETAARSDVTGYDGRYWPSVKEKYEKYHANDAQAAEHPDRESLRIPKGSKLPAVLEVGAMKDGASPLQLFDMVGNVAELTSTPFKARSTFKPLKLGKIKVDRSIFNEDKVVVRGGHNNSRQLLASSIFRFGVAPTSRAQVVGARRARSIVPGEEVLNIISFGGALDARLQDYKLLKSDEKADRPRPAIDDNPDRFTALEKFNWDETHNVPGEAQEILIANRKMNEIASDKELRRLSEGEDEVKDAILLGIFHTDVPVLEPELAPGTWFLSFKKGWKYKDEQTKKRVKIPDRYIFTNRRAGIAPVYLNVGAGASTITTNKVGVTKFEVERNADKAGAQADQLSCIWVHETPGGRRGLLTEIRMKFAKGALEGFK